MGIEWLASGLIVYRHRDDIRHMLATGWKAFFGTRTDLAFTGMQGVGKTVLLDHLTGKAFEDGYALPLQSQAIDRGTVSLKGQRLRVSVVPGQNAQPRQTALDTLFEGKKPVNGVVHAVANGFASVRSPGAVDVLLRDVKLTTIKKYCDYHRDQELKDLEETCEAIRKAHQRHRLPSWLVVAVGKVDLYQDSIDKARKYYSPEGDSPFTARLRRLESQVGTDNFRWTAIPVCSLVEAFDWNTRQVASQIDELARDDYLAQFLRELREYSRK